MSAIGQDEILPVRHVIRALVVFLVLTAILGSGAYYLILKFGLVRYHVAALMWTPGLAALLTCKILGLGVGILSWQWGESRWHLAAYFLPLVYGLVAYGFIWQMGLGGLVDSKFLAEIGRYLGLSGWSETGTMIFGAIMLATVGMIWHLATSLGEEIGWRGFLTPQLMRLTSFPVASLVTGLIWSAWHLPLIYYTTYNAGPVNLHLQMASFTLMTIGLSFIMTYLRLKSKSLWPATTLHAAHNVFILNLLQPMTVQYEETWRYANEFGMVLPIVVALFGLYAWYRASDEGLMGPLNR